MSKYPKPTARSLAAAGVSPELAKLIVAFLAAEDAHSKAHDKADRCQFASAKHFPLRPDYLMVNIGADSKKPLMVLLKGIVLEDTIRNSRRDGTLVKKADIAKLRAVAKVWEAKEAKVLKRAGWLPLKAAMDRAWVEVNRLENAIARFRSRSGADIAAKLRFSDYLGDFGSQEPSGLLRSAIRDAQRLSARRAA